MYDAYQDLRNRTSKMFRSIPVGRALPRLSQNSKTVPKKFEKHHQNTFDENQNAPYRKYGSRFFRQKRAGRVLRQSQARHPYQDGTRVGWCLELGASLDVGAWMLVLSFAF